MNRMGPRWRNGSGVYVEAVRRGRNDRRSPTTSASFTGTSRRGSAGIGSSLPRATRQDSDDADLWTLNEVDLGTARAGNRDVARELADRLGLHWIHASCFYEFTKGPGSDASAPGENAIGLHGIAIFSRWPLDDPGSADLPDCFDYFRLPEEKRYGVRRVLWATVRHPRQPFTLATAHFEVRNLPACRARQMAGALAALPDGPCLFAGDWNTHTFRRGSLLSSAREFVRLQRTSATEIDRQLVEPRDREPSLRMVEQAGFDLGHWNEVAPTALQVLSGVEELGGLPGPVRRGLQGLFRLERRTLRMRLDWIAVRGPWTRVPGVDGAWTETALGPDGAGASDHAPIGIAADGPKRLPVNGLAPGSGRETGRRVAGLRREARSLECDGPPEAGSGRFRPLAGLPAGAGLGSQRVSSIVGCNAEGDRMRTIVKLLPLLFLPFGVGAALAQGEGGPPDVPIRIFPAQDGVAPGGTMRVAVVYDVPADHHIQVNEFVFANPAAGESFRLGSPSFRR